MSDLQANFKNNLLNIFNSLSFYSPLIVLTSVFVFSMFTSSIAKFGWYLLWFFIVSCIRYFMYKAVPNPTPVPAICDTFIPVDYTYSTYVLTFTMVYFIMPMILVSKQNKINAMNYGILGFFISYIALDMFVKMSLKCIPTFFSAVVIGNMLGGVFCGVVAVLVMYSSTLKNYLFINEVNSNKEVCSMPSKQQFKCKLYKNGELVGDV